MPEPPTTTGTIWLSPGRQTCEWLKKRSQSSDSRPWVLYAGLVAPHFPYIIPEEFFKMYPLTDIQKAHAHPENGYIRHPWVERFMQVFPGMDRNSEEERRVATAAYFGLCSFLDHNIGRMLEALAEAGYADNTRVIYTSDHGDMIGSRGQWGKCLLYDDSTSIPLIMAGADIPGNSICETPVSMVDFYPTILESVDCAAAPEEKSLPGQSLYRSMNNPTDENRVVFSEYHAVGAPLRQISGKILKYLNLLG